MHFPQFFTINYEHIEDSKDAVHYFNKYFVSVGPRLAEKIPDPTTAGALNVTLISRNPYSMFLTAVGESEILVMLSVNVKIQDQLTVMALT